MVAMCLTKTRVVSIKVKLLILVTFIILFYGFKPFSQTAIDKLRKNYIVCLKNFEGTKYKWGGEDEEGIDCSGLARIAMTDALLRSGVFRLNPKIWWNALDLAWHDQSAKSIAEGQRGNAIQLPIEPSFVNSLDHTLILPGDMAVLKNKKRSHVMIYLGGNQWIEAAAKPGEVRIASIPHQDRQYSKVPCEYFRWKYLMP